MNFSGGNLASLGNMNFTGGFPNLGNVTGGLGGLGDFTEVRQLRLWEPGL